MQNPEDWKNYYDMELYSSDGKAYINAYELEVPYGGGIQTNSSKWHSFEIPLDASHDAMLTALFDDQFWRIRSTDETPAELWQDHCEWVDADRVRAIAEAGTSTDDELGAKLTDFVATLPEYTMNDWNK